MNESRTSHRERCRALIRRESMAYMKLSLWYLRPIHTHLKTGVQISVKLYVRINDTPGYHVRTARRIIYQNYLSTYLPTYLHQHQLRIQMQKPHMPY